MNQVVLPTWEAATTEVEEILASPRLDEHNRRLIMRNLETAADEMDSLMEAVSLGPGNVRASLRKARDAVSTAKMTIRNYGLVLGTHPVFRHLDELERQLTP